MVNGLNSRNCPEARNVPGIRDSMGVLDASRLTPVPTRQEHVPGHLGAVSWRTEERRNGGEEINLHDMKT